MQTAWDSIEDDREFDLERKEREGWEKMGRGFEESEVFELDVRLRVRLGAARMGEGKVDEAKVSIFAYSSSSSSAAEPDESNCSDPFVLTFSFISISY